MATFPFPTTLPPAMQTVLPWFRIVPAQDLLGHFASDRRHMRDEEGQLLKVPPPWPVIQGDLATTDHNLDQWIDTSFDAPGFGQVVKSKEELLALLSTISKS